MPKYGIIVKGKILRFLDFSVPVVRMSYFGTQLEELLKRKNMKAVDLARLSGVGESLISRYRSGEQVWVSPEDLAAIATSISDSNSERAELVRAHLLDEKTGPGSELVRVEVASAPAMLKEDFPAYAIRLPEQLERAFQILRENAINDADVRDVVLGLGNLLSEGRAPGQVSSVPAAPSRKGRKGRQAEIDRRIAEAVRPSPPRK